MTTGDQVRAAVCRAFGEPLQIEEVELRAPGPGEVGVALAACAICHSDLTFLRGAWGGELPAVYGHEAAGIVDRVGSGVIGIAPGDHVVVTLARFCGRCRMCLGGQPVLCVRRTAFPLSRDSPLRTADGAVIQQGVRTAAFAERVTVDASQIVPIPAEVPLQSASLLACAVITGVGAVLNTAGVQPGATVGVIGAGGVGLNSIQGAVLAGARTVLAIDLLDARLAAARAFGATHTLRADTDDVPGSVTELTGGDGLDYLFVTAGSAQAIKQGIELVATAGALVLVGLPPGAQVAFDVEAIADRAIRVLGSKLGAARPQLDIPRLVDLYRQGRLKLDELISGRFPLAEINDPISRAQRGEGLRWVIDMSR
ncbi:MAG: zinc-binding dehydrogenase [Sciscionella sp.]